MNSKRSAVNSALKVLTIQLGRQAILPAAWQPKLEEMCSRSSEEEESAVGEMAGKGLLEGRP